MREIETLTNLTCVDVPAAPWTREVDEDEQMECYQPTAGAWMPVSLQGRSHLCELVMV